MDELFESLTLVQTERNENFGVVLFGSEYWGGLLGWLSESMLARGYVAPQDLEMFEVTDDPAEAVEHIRRRLHAVAHTEAEKRNSEGAVAEPRIVARAREAAEGKEAERKDRRRP